MTNGKDTWPGFEIKYAEEELAREYPNVSMEIISMVVAMAKVAVPPPDGRVRLLQVARSKLSR